MDTHERIQQSRRLVIIGVMLGYATALILTVVRLINTEPLTVGEIMGSVAIGAAIAAPPTMALLSLDRRPTLLPAAIFGALASTVVAFWLLPVWLASAYLWYRGWTARPVRAEVSTGRAAARIGVGFLVVAALLALFVHRDPTCTQLLSDGTSRTVDAETRGYRTGWIIGGGGISTQTTSSLSENVEQETCSSDTIVPGEAIASLMLTGIVVGAGLRWPQGRDLSSEPRPDTHALRASRTDG